MTALLSYQFVQSKLKHAVKLRRSLPAAMYQRERHTEVLFNSVWQTITVHTFSQNQKSGPLSRILVFPSWTGRTCWFSFLSSSLIFSNLSFQVYFVDYGNSETVSAASLLPLSTELAELSPQGIHCSLCRVSPSADQDLLVQSCDMVEEEFQETAFLDLLILGPPVDEVLPVDLLIRTSETANPDHSMSDLLLMAGVAEVGPGPAVCPASTQYSPFTPPKEESFLMRFSHIDKFGHLYGNCLSSGQ